MNKRHTSLILLSIIIPVSLLSAFRLSGVLLGGQGKLSTDTADAIQYRIERPSDLSDIDQNISSDYVDVLNKFSLKIALWRYYENLATVGGYDLLEFGTTLVAYVSSGFIDSIVMRFSYSNDSVIDVFGHDMIRTHNLDLINVRDMRLGNSYVNTLGINRPRNCSLYFPVWWILADEPHETLNITASAEITTFNGTAFRKFVMPIFLILTGDAGNNLESALQITPGGYRAYVGLSDPNDFFKIQVDQNQYINVKATPRSFPNSEMSLDLYLYDPSGSKKAQTINPDWGASEALSFKTDSSGWWFIEVRWVGGYYSEFYNLTVFTSTYPEFPEDNLQTVLHNLGYLNVQPSNLQIFPRGTYQVKLLAEFAEYHQYNNLSWYRAGKSTYNQIFSGADGGYSYVNPPVPLFFPIYDEFGLSFCSPEHRYFTETSRNPDGLQHAIIYQNLDDPNMYLIGFENQFGQEGDDWNDMVISLEKTASLPSAYLVVGVSQSPPEGVSILIDGTLQTVTMNNPFHQTMTGGYHAIQAEEGFLRLEGSPPLYYTYTFNHWSDNGSTDNPRDLLLVTGTTLTAIYTRSRYGMQ